MFVISRNFREKSRLPQTHLFQPIITMPKRSPLTPISANKTPRRELSTFIKSQISGLARAGLIPTEIHHQLNVSRTTIQSFLQREQNNSVWRKKTPMRPAACCYPSNGQIRAAVCSNQPKNKLESDQNSLGVDDLQADVQQGAQEQWDSSLDGLEAA